MTNDLITGIVECLKQAPEFKVQQVLDGIHAGRYKVVRGEHGFVLLETYPDAHLRQEVVNIFMAYSRPGHTGLMESLIDDILEYAHGRTIIFQTYAHGYQEILEAGKEPNGLIFEPYCWKYTVKKTK